jgi:hypothetical protein
LHACIYNQYYTTTAAVINLLRAPSVDSYIAQGKTVGIAENNEKRLKERGRKQLKATFDRIMAMQ